MEEKTLGDALKSIRKSKDISIAEVSLATHIPERFVEALENNQPDQLPSLVQGKGYLRNLLRYYKLNADSYLQAWENNLHFVDSQQIPTSTPTIDQTESGHHQTPEPSAEIRSNAVFPQDTETSQEIFASIGRELASRRIQVGLELADAEAFTHIIEHNLSFLEKGAYEQIPSPVQARGMLKIYAEFLELDVRHILQRYAEGLRKKRLEQLALEEQPQKKRPRVQIRKNTLLSGILTPDFLIVGAIVVGLFILIIWGTSYVVSLKQEADWEKLGIDRNIVSQLTASETPTITPSPTLLVIPTEDTALNGNPLPGNTTENISEAAIQVNVTAQQRAWVRITADGKIIFEDRLVPGNPYNFNAEQQLSLETGNAGGLQILFNNQYLGTLGKIGEVNEYIFTAAGIITPTPQFSATPTATVEPSITPTPTATVATPTVTPFIP